MDIKREIFHNTRKKRIIKSQQENFNTPQFKFEIKKEVEFMCNKGLSDDEKNLINQLPGKFKTGSQIIAQKTNYDNIFVVILLGGYDMNTGKINTAFKQVKNQYCSIHSISFCSMIPIGELVQYTSTLSEQGTYFKTIDELSEFANIMNVLTIMNSLIILLH